MATIALRAYIREIESLIDHNQTETAIAHCLHILQFMPKHIGTYRMLGKSLHEIQRYADAADVFQRVLSAIPDDFVSNVGLSIIRQDEGNLDAAIWHMERAFESQPSNLPIQEELRRLYGKRDGLELPRVRLTRGALARMYTKGHLYNQAIGELRAALAEDPNRADLQVLLAQAYFQTGQKVEAVEVCGQLIKKLPYCLEANRLLALILPGTERTKDSEIYRQRAISLDPYLKNADANTFISDSIPDSSVTLDRLDILPGEASSEVSQPGWAASLGTAFDASEPTELPEWLKQDQISIAESGADQISELTQTTGEDIPWETSTGRLGTDWLKQYEQAVEADQESIDSSEEPSIPEWMRAAGWEPSESGQTEAPISWEEFEAQGEGEIEAGEIPDWLKSIAPGEAEGTETAAPTWLQENPPGASDTVINWLNQNQREVPTENLTDLESALDQVIADNTEEPVLGAEEVPDWLRGLETEGPSEGPTTGELTIPEWLKEDEAKQQSTPETLRTNIEWLKGIEAESATKNLGPTTQGPTAATSAGDIPEWLKPLDTDEPSESDSTDTWLTAISDETMIVPRSELSTDEKILSETLDSEGMPAGESSEGEIEEPVAKLIQGEVISKEADQTLIAEATAQIDHETFEEPATEILADETLIARTKVTEKLPEAELEQDTPDWLKEMMDESQAVAADGMTGEEPDAAASPSTEETMIGRTPTIETHLPVDPSAAESGLMDEDDALALLAALAEKHSGEEGWLDTVVAETMGEDASVYAEEVERTSEHVSAPEFPEPKPAPEEAQSPTIVEGEAEAIAWLETIAESEEPSSKPPDEHSMKTTIEPPAWVINEEITEEKTVIGKLSGDEIPDWLREPVEEETGDVQSTTEEIDLPKPLPISPKIDLNTASLSELEDLPGVGFILAQSILYHRQMYGKFEQLEDLANVPGLSQSEIEGFRDWVEIRPEHSDKKIVTRQFGEPRNEIETALKDARQAISSSDLVGAALHYDLLIKQNQYLPEIIQDIQDVLSQNPNEVSLWQTLGDACMRNDQLQEALEAYNRAEELLR